MQTRPSMFSRKFLVDKRLQLSISVYFLLLNICIFIVLIIALRFMVFDSLHEFLKFTPTRENLSLYVEHILEVAGTLVIVFGVISIIFSSLGIIVLTNRFAGPIFRFKGILKSLNDGEKVNLLKVRKGDFCQDFYLELIKYIERNENK